VPHATPPSRPGATRASMLVLRGYLLAVGVVVFRIVQLALA